MENASKALIIAGAILVSILLISIGVMVIQSTGNVQQGMAETMDSSAIQQFNGKFDPYVGNTQSASNVKGLLSAVIANNASSSHQIKVKTTNAIGSLAAVSTATNASTTISSISAAVLNSKQYEVKIEDTEPTGTGNQDGYYDLVTIKQK